MGVHVENADIAVAAGNVAGVGDFHFHILHVQADHTCSAYGDRIILHGLHLFS